MSEHGKQWDNERLCHLTTIGRRSGDPHEIEIWFATHDGRVYLLSGNQMRADWIRNLTVNPAVGLRVGDHHFDGTAQLVSDPEEDALARRLLAGKYQDWHEGQPLSKWAQTSTPVRIDLPSDAG